MLKECTAAELADALEVMDGFPHNTGGLSMLDEATLAFGWRYPTVGPAQEAFAAARHRHKRSYTTERGAASARQHPYPAVQGAGRVGHVWDRPER